MSGNDGVTLQIKINPKMIERIFYLAVIITLAIFLVLGTFCDKGACKTEEDNTQQTDTTTTTATAQEQQEKTVAEVQAVEEEQPPAEETTEETPAANDTQEPAEEPAQIVYSGDVDITINEVMTEIKGTDVKYGKVTGVRFTIKNEKDNFMPLVKVYTYEDGDTSSVFAKTPRTERIFSELKLGKSTTQELDIISQQFTNLNSYVICKVVVYNKVTEKELATATQKIKIT